MPTAPSTPAPASSPTSPATAEPTQAANDIDGLFNIGGHRLYLKCTGTGSPTILYFHGAIEDRSTMPVSNAQGIRSRIDDEYRFCAYDRRNVGRSDTVDAPQRPNDVLSDVENLLAAAGVAGPYVLLGASFGGIPAYLFANRHPDDVLGIVLLDAMFPDDLELDIYWPEAERYETLDEEDECCTLERISHYKMLVAASEYIGQERDIPLIYLASKTEGLTVDADAPPEYRAVAPGVLQAFVDRFSPGTLRQVDSPHFMEVAIPDQIADALREVISMANQGVGEPQLEGRIAFGREVEYDPLFGQIVALYAVDPDGSNLVQLTDGASAFPAWSPDGTRLAFALRIDDGSWQVATIAPDGSDLQVLTSGPGIHEVPSWAPDGSWIAYGFSPTMPDDESFHTVIYRMAADGSNPELLGNPDAFDVEARVSPDGTKVVFARLAFDGDDMQSSLVVRDIESGQEESLVAPGNAVKQPNWSPDGEYIVYSNLDSSYLARVRADGSGEAIVIYRAPGNDAAFKPSYSPDGGRIVFGCSGPAGDDALCLIDADGSNLEILVDEPGVHENHFSWGVTPSP